MAHSHGHPEMVQHFQDPHTPSSLYGQQYLEAVYHFNNGETERCVSVAKLNLTDPTLPRFYQMKNMILLATAEEDWYEAVKWRKKTETLWKATKAMTPSNEQEAQAALGQLRDSIRYWRERHEERAPATIDEARLAVDDETEKEDSEAVELQKKADEEAATLTALWGEDFVTRATQGEKMKWKKIAPKPYPWR
ncbi:uncharacterized protein LTR77_001719 [Saxophila tyrrhenica]|uniref:Uncharacterized protein n=1 Tax=Saxophila tyrrhenica TaxID=1690608 RepID=A0AAV9PQP3_9PEZI|nr:hypothetical protein LTR77_001719 [Saxophila tyrrhenica]